MRTTWQRLRSIAAPAALIGAATAVTLLVLGALLWWQHEDRPWPVLAWAAVKGVLWSKTVFKVALAAGLGVVIGVRALARRVSPGQVDGGRGPVPAALAEAVPQRHEAQPGTVDDQVDDGVRPVDRGGVLREP
ncbi:hypothetical protein ACFPIJ_40210 [Dactylosporangium cerinum]|uniref:Uncharacterized protein n=1 Tax=Dactylosporangium cerinum TaxID=1434730 RepID=A0ABV9W9N8_9ACTN